MALHKTIWRPAIVQTAQENIIKKKSLHGWNVTFLPPTAPYTFLADPFGLWHDNKLFVFVEFYDYWQCHGVIYVYIYNRDFQLLDSGLALKEPWHLSYPYVFKAHGELWMLPEAWKSGTLTLYKSTDFPYKWQKATHIELHDPAGIPIDATPYYDNGLWWLFYSPQTPKGPLAQLHVAFAPTIDGPWQRHPQNPIYTGKEFSRPGGTACKIDGQMILPVQDCSQTYGGALRFLTFHKLTTHDIHVSASSALHAPVAYAPYTDGFHTLSAAQNVTLIDVKYRHFSLKGFYLELRHQLRKLRHLTR